MSKNTCNRTSPLAWFLVLSLCIVAAASGQKAYLTVCHSGSNLVSILDPGAGAITGTIANPYPCRVAMKADTDRAYVTSLQTNLVAVIDTNSDSIVQTIDVGAKQLDAVVAGGFVYVSNHYTDAVSVIDASTDTYLTTIPVHGAPTHLAASADGSRVAVVNSGPKTLQFIDTSTHSMIWVVALQGNDPREVALSPDGSTAYVLDFTAKHVEKVPYGSGNKEIIALPSAPLALALSPDGSSLYVTQNTSIAVIDTGSSSITANMDAFRASTSLGLSADGSRLYVGQSYSSGGGPIEAEVKLFDTGTQTLLDTIDISSMQQVGGIGVTGQAISYDVCSECPFTTLQAAVDNASPGDTITLGPGDHYGKTIIDGKPLTILGQGKGETRLKPTQQVTERVLRVKGSGAVVTLEDLSLEDGLSTVNGGCLSVGSGSDVTLTNVDIRGCAAQRAGGGAFVSGAKLTIKGMNNDRSAVSGNDGPVGGGAFRVTSSGELVLENVDITGNQTAAKGGAIECLNGCSVSIDGMGESGNQSGAGSSAFFINSSSIDLAGADLTGTCVKTASGQLNDNGGNTDPSGTCL